MGNRVPWVDRSSTAGEVVAARPQSLRYPFHCELDDVRKTIARLSATVTEDILRATDIVLTQDLDAAERMIVADDELDATCVGRRAALLPPPRPAGPRRIRSP